MQITGVDLILNPANEMGKLARHEEPGQLPDRELGIVPFTRQPAAAIERDGDLARFRLGQIDLPGKFDHCH